MSPRRIRLQRTAGWRKPSGAVVVARPTRWGNPFEVGVDGDRAQCVGLYLDALERGRLAVSAEDARNALMGRDLACWCPLEEPCHADVLLELANGSSSVPGSHVLA